MVFLDFFEALLGCAEVYVVDASEQTDMTVTGEQQPDITAEITTEQTATSPMSHSPSLVEQVLSLYSLCAAAQQCINGDTSFLWRFSIFPNPWVVTTEY